MLPWGPQTGFDSSGDAKAGTCCLARHMGELSPAPALSLPEVDAAAVRSRSAEASSAPSVCGPAAAAALPLPAARGSSKAVSARSTPTSKPPTSGGPRSSGTDEPSGSCRAQRPQCVASTGISCFGTHRFSTGCPYEADGLEHVHKGPDMTPERNFMTGQECTPARQGAGWHG